MGRGDLGHPLFENGITFFIRRLCLQKELNRLSKRTPIPSGPMETGKGTTGTGSVEPPGVRCEGGTVPRTGRAVWTSRELTFSGVSGARRRVVTKDTTSPSGLGVLGPRSQ